VSSFLPFSAAGLFLFAMFRAGLRREDYDHFGVWHGTPSWARLLFGGVDGSISPYRLAGEALGLTWAIFGFAIFVTGDPPGSPLRQILGAPILLSLAGVAVCWTVVSVGQARRGRRLHRPSNPTDGVDGVSHLVVD
jgi:hypothetical protein